MRKIIFLIHVSLDGFAAGPNGEIDWLIYNDEVGQYSYELHDTTDTAVYGRVTYEMMAAYWPTVLDNPNSAEGERQHARWLKDATKIVVSRTFDSFEWENTVPIQENLVQEFTKLKQQPGKDMWLLGSPTLARSFMQLGLIDEYRINVNPVMLGNGKSLFGTLEKSLKLELLETRTFAGGVVGLRYVPKRESNHQ